MFLRFILVPVALFASCGRQASVVQRSSTIDVDKELWGELDIQGRVDEVSVSPSGHVWLTDKIGNSYAADSITGSWRYGPFKPAELALAGGAIDRITFFSRDTAIATGYLTAQAFDRESYVVRTTDGGRTWDSVSIGESLWIYDVFRGQGGEAWLGGSSGHFYHTRDYGRSWKALTAPFDGSLRVHSIFMVSSREGVVGALGNAIKATRDGGQTWRVLPTPVDQELCRPPGEIGGDQIDKILVLGRYLVVRQCGRVFVTQRDAIEWRPLPGRNLEVIEADRSGLQIVGVTDSGHVVAVDTMLRSTKLADDRLYARAKHVTIEAGGVYVLDNEDGLYEIRNRKVRFSYPLTALHGPRYLNRVRQLEDRRWGTTSQHIYAYVDGRNWRRVGITHFAIRDMVPLSDHELMLWDGHGTNVVFDMRTGTTLPITDLGDHDVVDVIQTPHLWVAYGGQQHQTAQRVEVAQTFFGGQFRGSKSYGFVYVSRNSGRTWRQVDQWPEGGVAAAFVEPDGDIVLLSYLGSVRRLMPRGESYDGKTLLLATEANLDEVPYVQIAHALYFADDTTGYIGGWIHHIGNRYFQTRDGGRTWRQVESEVFPFAGIIPVGERYVGWTDDSLYLLHGRHRTRLSLSGPNDGRINDVSVAGRGDYSYNAIRTVTADQHSRR
jgi:photosystem II stability/assembly factor-like uncharacterized protein